MPSRNLIPAPLRELPAYLRQPHLIAPSGLRRAAAWRELGLLVAFELAVLLLIVVPLVLAWRHAFDLPSPTAFDQIPQKWLAPLVVLVAPLLEELFFRGWLTGRPRSLWLFGCALAFAGLAFASTQGLAPLAVSLAFLSLLLAAPIGWFVLRKRATPGWYARGFPAVFYLVLGSFALMHLTNFPSFSPLMIPLVLPQAWIGLMLGFTRMRIGLGGSMLMHIISNSAVIAIGTIGG